MEKIQCIQNMHVFMLSCIKHTCFHAFSAYFPPHDIIAEKGALPHYCLHTHTRGHLYLSRLGLGREVDDQGLVHLLVEAVHQLVLHVHRLAGAGRPDKEQGAVVANHHVHEVGVAGEGTENASRLVLAQCWSTTDSYAMA